MMMPHSESGWPWPARPGQARLRASDSARVGGSLGKVLGPGSDRPTQTARGEPQPGGLKKSEFRCGGRGREWPGPPPAGPDWAPIIAGRMVRVDPAATPVLVGALRRRVRASYQESARTRLRTRTRTHAHARARALMRARTCAHAAVAAVHALERFAGVSARGPLARRALARRGLRPAGMEGPAAHSGPTGTQPVAKSESLMAAGTALEWG
jgi:hypothetical protein